MNRFVLTMAITALPLLLGNGCAASPDLLERGEIRLEVVDGEGYQFDRPQIYEEGQHVLVSGILRGYASLAGHRGHVHVALVDNEGAVVQSVTKDLSQPIFTKRRRPLGPTRFAYSLRMARPLPHGATVKLYFVDRPHGDEELK